MKVLLDTNIIIHREANRVVMPDIGILFYWLDHLRYEKCIHPLTLGEIRKHQDPNVVATFEAKLNSYYVLKTESPESVQIQAIRQNYDKTANDIIDTSLLKELFNNRVDLLISEDRKIHNKAAELGIGEQVFTINTFLEKAVAENPELVDYKVLSVKKEHFGNINIEDSFFDSFKNDYPGFEKWFNKKADDIAYVCLGENNATLAFLYLKVELPGEDYSDIEPKLEPKKRLKIGTFKVMSNGFKLGERFLNIIFDNAMQYRVDEIYVTIFDKTEAQRDLIWLLQEWGFQYHGIKHGASGDERVYVRNFIPNADINNPKLTYPYFSSRSRKFIVPIYPEYHTELFPESILRTESPEDFIEIRPNRNALSKVYISRSIERNLRRGDVIVFYRTAFNGPAYFTAVATTIGIVQEVITNIANFEQFIALCRKRSVFTDEELREQWDYKPSHPFIVNFLYTISFSLGNRLNRKYLLELGIIPNEPPRGFVQLTDTAFQRLMENSHADQRHVVD